MFFLFRVTVKRLLALISVLIMAALVLDAVVAAKNDDEGVVCKNDSDRISYLRQKGIIADADPEWVKKTAIPEYFDSTWKEYASILAKNGYDITKYKGSTATIYCYEAKGENSGGYVRVIEHDNRVIGADVYFYT